MNWLKCVNCNKIFKDDFDALTVECKPMHHHHLVPAQGMTNSPDPFEGVTFGEHS